MAFGLRQLQPEEMGRGGVTRTLIRLAVPSAVAGLLATTYEAVDGLFISWLGVKQITGVAFGSTLLFFAFAIGAAVQLGVATLLSRRLGENDPEGARNVLEQALLVSFAVGMIGSLLGPLTAKPIVAWLGASDDELTHGARYISRITLGMVFMHVGMTAEAGLRAQGNTVTGMHVSLLGNVANLILDGFLIFGPNNPARDAPQVWGLRQAAAFFTDHGFDLGVQGGANATLMTRLLVAVLLLAALCSKRTRVRAGAPWQIRPNDFWRTIGRIYFLGVPVTVSIVGMAVSNGAINWILSQHNSTAAGVLNIARRLEMFAFVPIFSLSGAVVPVVSYNLGARLIPRCRRAILMGCLIAGVLMGAFGAVIFVFPAPVLRLFTQDPDMIAMGVSYLRINSWSYFFVGCDIILSAGLQGLGRAILSPLAQLTRAVFVKIPAAWVLATFVGVTGVWISNPISTLACFLLAAVLMGWALRHVPRHPPRGEAAAAPHEVIAPADLPPAGDMPPAMD
jgi:putative MATE family efflux protein